MRKFTDFFKKKAPPIKKEVPPEIPGDPPILPGRVSVPEDGIGNTVISFLNGVTKMVTPSFRREIVPLIRDLYKVNPDVNIALQDMFKLANTLHQVSFPNNTDKESDEMRDHLTSVTKHWSRYTAGIDGLVNRMMIQYMVGGAISVEAVPNKDLNGISTVLFLRPERIIFKREEDGVYSPYQINNTVVENKKDNYIKLNPETYFYCGALNDTDEPYGIPPFMPALDSLKTQADMKVNYKQIMEIAGFVGFLEALMEKPMKKANQSEAAYQQSLRTYLTRMKTNLRNGMKDGIVVGFKDDHEFNFHTTSKELGNLNTPWELNQQSVANGLGVNGGIIGLNTATGEGATGTALSKMISQLKNLQMMVSFVLERVYTLELRLAGYNPKGIRITWGPSTVTDDIKIQQANQYKIQNLNALYRDGIISLFQYAWEMGYDSPNEVEPRVDIEDQHSKGGSGDDMEGTKKDKRQSDKSKSDRRGRDKSSSTPRRKDVDSKPR